jgi:acyl-homoserine-lactone acylase
VTLLGRPMKKHYGVVGNTYMACVEFTDEVQAATLMQFGESGVPSSPHFMDQAKLLSERRFKPGRFDWKDIEAHAESKYQPGQEKKTARR